MHKKGILIVLLFLSGLPAFNQSHNLDYYIKEGLQNSPLLNEYRNQLSSAGYDSLLVRASRKPLIEAKSMLQYSPYYKNFGYDEVITDGGNYMAVLGISQNIFNKGELNNKLQAIDLQKKTINNLSKISETELHKLITDQYLAAYAGFKDLAFNKSFLDLLHNENEIVKQFVKNGVAKETDYLSLLVETQTQEILVNQVQSQYMKDLLLLNQLCGIADTSWYELLKPDITVKGSPDISRSPSYIQYKIDSIRIENEKTAVDLRYKPKVNWFADAGLLTSDPWNFYNHFGYSAGLGLNIPVYDGKQRGLEKQKLQFNENSRKAYENTFHNQYYQQFQQLRIELSSLDEMSSRMKAQLATSEQLIKVLKDQLEAGIIQMTEYLNAIKNFRSMNRNLNMVNIQKLQIINEMNFILTK